MKSYTVTEVEPEDWRHLNEMSLKEALEILEDTRHLDGYMGGYQYGSTDEFDFEKARIRYAIDTVCHETKKALTTKKSNQ